MSDDNIPKIYVEAADAAKHSHEVEVLLDDTAVEVGKLYSVNGVTIGFDTAFTMTPAILAEFQAEVGPAQWQGNVAAPGSVTAGYIPTWVSTELLGDGYSVNTVLDTPGLDTEFATAKAIRTAITNFTNSTGFGIATPGAAVHIASIGIIEANSDNATGPYVLFKKSRGSFASPSALQSGDVIGYNQYAGRGTTAYGANVAKFYAYAAEAFTDAAQGAGFKWATTLIGGVTTSVKMRLSDAGYLYVGADTSATYRIQLPNTASAAGQGQANAWATYSSRRWKENIHRIEDALAKVRALDGVYFDWKKEQGGTHSVGLIAEDVGKVIPEVVSYEENGIDASGLDYAHLVPVLIEAIKELAAKVEQLEKR